MKLILEAYFAGGDNIVMSRDLNYFDAHAFVAEFFDWFYSIFTYHECLKFQATMKFKNKIVFRCTDLRGFNETDAGLIISLIFRQFTPSDKV